MPESATLRETTFKGFVRRIPASGVPARSSVPTACVRRGLEDDRVLCSLSPPSLMSEDVGFLKKRLALLAVAFVDRVVDFPPLLYPHERGPPAV